MSLGHGQLGLLDRIRPFAELQNDTHANRRPYLELRLGKTLGSFSVHSGSVYKTTISASPFTFAGSIRAIVGVESLISPRPLTRVEQVSDVVAGTWFYDDAALGAGGSTDLYLRLPDSSNPSNTTVIALLLFAITTQGEVHPVFGPEKYANADVEQWSGGNPVSWTEVGAGAVQETGIVLSGLSSAKIGSASIGAGAFDGIEQARVGVQGAIYRVSAYYQTPLAGQAPEVEVRLRAGAVFAGPTNQFLLSDGRNLTTSNEGLRLAGTFGEWKRYLLDFVWDAATTANLQAGIFLKNTAGSAKAGTLYVDRLWFRRIYRYEPYVAGLSAESIPELEVMTASMLFGEKTIGAGGVSFLNGDGELAKAFAQLFIINKPATIYVGGSFGNGVDEIYRDDWRAQFPGITRQPDVGGGRISFELDDARKLTKVLVPPNNYRIADLANLDPNKEGKPKPLLFGETSEHIVEGVRVDKDANGYGYYELLDPAVPVADGVNVILPTSYSIKAYPNKELADLDQKGYVITDSTNDFSVGTNNTKWHVLRDVRNYQYDRGGNDVGTNSRFTFDTDLSAQPADKSVDIDISGPAYKVAADLQAAMRAAIGGGDTVTTVTYSESTHKFTVARPGGGKSLGLYMTVGFSAGVAAHKESWKLLGFDTKADKTGAQTYTSDEATFTDAESDHVIRFVAGGYKDDAAGSICGTASAPIDTPPAMASWLLQKVAKVPASNIDVAGTFASARSGCQGDFCTLFSYLDNPEDLYTALAWLGRVGLIDFMVDGDGIWRAKKYAATTTGAREFFDRDYLSWRMWQEPADIYKDVRIQGGYHPAKGRFMVYADAPAVIDKGVPVKYGDERILDFMGHLSRGVITGGTQLVSGYYGRLIGKNPRFVEFRAAGKLVDLLVGDKVKPQCTGPDVLDPTGALNAVAIPIDTSSVANPTVITTSTPHYLTTGDVADITGHVGSSPSIDGERTVTVTGPTTFTIPINVTTGGTGGSLIKRTFFRILGLRHNYVSGESICTAVEDVKFLS